MGNVNCHQRMSDKTSNAPSPSDTFGDLHSKITFEDAATAVDNVNCHQSMLDKTSIAPSPSDTFSDLHSEITFEDAAIAMDNVNCHQHTLDNTSIAPSPSDPFDDLHSEITFEDAAKKTPTTPDEMWDVVEKSSSSEGIYVKPTTDRKGWKTIRLFVSSTFMDFHQEREVLVKQVFPDLRLWCESRKLHLVECDLRWGIPNEMEVEDTIKIRLGELDRCYEENTAPFFLNLVGDRAGWVPQFGDLSGSVAAQYGWVHGLSVTEMEMVHGTMRKQNPNALFMIRHADGADQIPDKAKSHVFQQQHPRLEEKQRKLKSVIREKFPETNVKQYTVHCRHDKQTNRISFDDLDEFDSVFCTAIFDFFKKRIDELYPLDSSPSDPLQVQKLEHEAFMLSRSSCVLGRETIISGIQGYIEKGSPSNSPLAVVGVSGAGKSAVLAKCTHNALMLAEKGKMRFLTSSCERVKVFFHFVGSTPRSSDLTSFLQRLTNELKPNQTMQTKTDLDLLINLSYNLLQSPTTEPIVVFVDALNQMDEDNQQFLSRWLPEKLSPNIRVIVSTIEGTSTHKTLRLFKSNLKEIVCGPLDEKSRQSIVTNIFERYNKKFGEDQMELLLSKDGSQYPLWLTLACEELRVFGVFEKVSDKIKQLPSDLIDLGVSLFQRFEGQPGGDLMKACVSMLEVSRHGLLEKELLALLAQKERMKEPDYMAEDEVIPEVSTEKESSVRTDKIINDTKEKVAEDVKEVYIKEELNEKETEERKRGKVIPLLPASEWAIIYQNLKPLLRPCGDLGEGRLDFYHRSLSKAVRKRYFSGEDEMKLRKYKFWHGVLSDYFEGVQDMDRKAEELPYHLEKLMDKNRLVQCLMDWNVFERMYCECVSTDLLHLWQQCGGYSVAAGVYKEQLVILRTSGDVSLIRYAALLEKVSIFFIQAGTYPEALEIMKERLDDELERIGERKDKLADIYYGMAKCKYNILSSGQYNNILCRLRQVVECGLKSIEYRKGVTSDDNEYRCALSYEIVAITRSHISFLDAENAEDEIRMAFEANDEATKVFRKLNDMQKMAACVLDKASISKHANMPFEEVKQLYLESVEICLKAYGERHANLGSNYFNMFLFFERHGEEDTAFKYLLKCRDNWLAAFGPSHPRTEKPLRYLKREPYSTMLKLKEQSVAETA